MTISTQDMQATTKALTSSKRLTILHLKVLPHGPIIHGAAAKVFGQLVVLGFDVAVFTPAPYQRRSLRRPSYGALILWPASHLDAFSAYPIPTRIPGGAPGGTTGKPEVGQPRSSRTSGRTTQDSHAHDR